MTKCFQFKLYMYQVVRFRCAWGLVWGKHDPLLTFSECASVISSCESVISDRNFVITSCESVIPGPEVIKLFSCSTQLSTKFFLLINVKMPTIVGILTFRSRKNSILSLSESEKS